MVAVEAAILRLSPPSALLAFSLFGALCASILTLPAFLFILRLSGGFCMKEEEEDADVLRLTRLLSQSRS